MGKCLLIENKHNGKSKKIVVVGDLHLGFEEALNRTGVFVSREMFNDIIKYLDGIFEVMGRVDEIVLLGDVKHVFGQVLKQEWNDVL